MKPTTNELLDALREYGKAAAKRPTGPDWMSLDEMAREEGLSLAAMRYRIKCFQRRGGKLDTASGTTLDDEGRAKRCAYYKFLSSPNGKKP